MPRYAYDRLTALDNSFLVLEKPNAYMHVASTQIFDAGPLGLPDGGVDAEAIKSLVASLLHLIPRYRQKLRYIPIEGRPVWVDDERFNSHEKRCEEHRLELLRTLEEVFGTKDSDHWRTELNARQMSADIIEEYSYPADDPSVVRNRYIIDVQDEATGPQRMLGFPVHMSESPAALGRRAPRLGQHSAEVLRDLAGASDAEIAQLESAGVVAS